MKRRILIVLIGLVFGFALWRWNAESMTGNAMPMPFGFGVGVVRSGSMEPELSVDDLIFVVECDEYEIGDTVVYQRRTTLVVHKIVAIEDGTAVTQGTANNAADEPIDISSIKGKVVFHIDGAGVAVDALTSPLGTLCTLAVAVGLLVRSYANERKELEEKKAELKREIEDLKGKKDE